MEQKVPRWREILKVVRGWSPSVLSIYLCNGKIPVPLKSKRKAYVELAWVHTIHPNIYLTSGGITFIQALDAVYALIAWPASTNNRPVSCLHLTKLIRNYAGEKMSLRFTKFIPGLFKFKQSLTGTAYLGKRYRASAIGNSISHLIRWSSYSGDQWISFKIVPQSGRKRCSFIGITFKSRMTCDLNKSPSTVKDREGPKKKVGD